VDLFQSNFKFETRGKRFVPPQFSGNLFSGNLFSGNLLSGNLFSGNLFSGNLAQNADSLGKSAFRRTIKPASLTLFFATRHKKIDRIRGRLGMF
jgi:hypothetical protein